MERSWKQYLAHVCADTVTRKVRARSSAASSSLRRASVNVGATTQKSAFLMLW